MRVLLFPNRSKDTELAVTRQAVALLQSSGAEVLAGRRFLPLLGDMDLTFLPRAEAFKEADAVLTVGGDGTLLEAGAACIEQEKPILGINLGRTGFLATCEVSELAIKLPRLAAGDFTLEPRSLLLAECAVHGWRHTAINEVVLYGKSRLHPMDYTVFCDGVPVGRYRCDGIIAATPTGSTAYALSAGGPALDALAQVLEIIPICAHGGQHVPLVFSAGRRLTVTAEHENRDNIFVCADSQDPCELLPGDNVEICLSPKRLPLISFDHTEQFRAVINKLMRR